MKTATLPAVRVAPELREQLRGVLREGESVSSFIEEVVSRAIEYRRAQRQFHERGEKAWREYERTGSARPAEDVFDELERRVSERLKGLRKP